MRYKRTFTKYEECMLNLKGGFSILPELRDYLNSKELLLFVTLVEICQQMNVGEKYITVNYTDCTKSNKELADKMRWSLSTTIKWSNQLEKLGFISTERKSHVLIRKINSKLIYDTQKKLGPVLSYYSDILRKICGDKHLSQISEEDMRHTKQFIDRNIKNI